MRDTANLIKTPAQYDCLKALCAQVLDVAAEGLEIGLIADIGNGNYKVKVMYKHMRLYSMIYDGEKITEYYRLIY